MMERLTSVRLRFPMFRKSLQLSRVPKYLRFVCQNIGKPGREWDALDQLDDQPKPEEEIIAAVLVDRTSVHLDGVNKATGKRFGKWIEEAVYEPTAVQPPDDTLRDTAKWQAWCEAQLKGKD